MNKVKVLNRKQIESLLNDGNILSYHTITGKVYVIDSNLNKLGSVQFNTFLKVTNNTNIKRIESIFYLSEDYKYNY